MRSRVASLTLLVVMVMPLVGSAAPLTTLTLSGPAEYDPGVALTVGGSWNLGSVVGLAAQPVSILVDGAPSQVVTTGIDGTYAAQLTFSELAPYRHTVRAVAQAGTPLETSSPTIEITMHVRLVGLDIAPRGAHLPVGLTIQYTATGLFSDGTSADLTQAVAWTSSQPTFATVSNGEGTRGQVTGVAPGTSNIGASIADQEGVTQVTVDEAAVESIKVISPSPTVTVGESLALTAIGHFSDGTTSDVTERAEWTSSAPQIATVSNASGTKGIVTGQNPGHTVITASIGAVSDGADVSVHDAPTSLVINEVDYDQPGTDTNEFIEIYNGTREAVSLDGLALVLVNGSDGNEYSRVSLSGVLAAGGYAVAASPTVPVAPGAMWFTIASTNAIQNGGPDAIALFDTSTFSVIDALSYEGSVVAARIAGAPGTYNLVEGSSTTVFDDATDNTTMVRSPNGSDTNDAMTDWSLGAPTPGAPN